MRILIVYKGIIPKYLYGGIERVIWSLGKELTKLGHQVTYLVKNGSHCDFADVVLIDESKSIIEQIPNNIDIAHFNFEPEGVERIKIPYIITMHGNSNDLKKLDKNTVFVSKNHAERYASDCYVYNGLDWDEYTKPDFNLKREYFHFLGKAAWHLKNVQGAIDIIKSTPNEKLVVMGGKRFNFNMGIRFTFSPRIKFVGMVGGENKYRLLNASKGLIFPVRWHEPFGLAIIESLYYGCPVFATPYGSLQELVKPEYGYLSNNRSELAQAILNAGSYSAKACYEYARDEFNSKRMAVDYLKKYDSAMSGKILNQNNPQLKEIQTEKFLKWE